jgi:hypothetical protein
MYTICKNTASEHYRTDERVPTILEHRLYHMNMAWTGKSTDKREQEINAMLKPKTAF